MARARRLYVISDLHLGGEFPTNHTRGFRMMTRPDALAAFILRIAAEPTEGPVIELVINGDFIDFLAEEALPDIGPDGPTWKAFLDRPGEALLVFERICARRGDAAVFDALAALLRKGHQLTLLLGNHDVELALPEVRDALARRLGAETGSALRCLFTNEAYAVGEVLIEHGNRYDPPNMVDYDGLRRLCSLRSRAQYDQEASARYRPPLGSRLVAEVMNPLKSHYGFIDLLKPESEPLFALILALEPSSRDSLLPLLRILYGIKDHRLAASALPEQPANISAISEDADDHELVERMLRAIAMPGEDSEAEDAREMLPASDTNVRIASRGDQLVSRAGLAALLGAGTLLPANKRLELVRKSLRALNGDATFDDDIEVVRRYLDAADELAGERPPEQRDLMPARRYSTVVFGHTHHAKKVALNEKRAVYINTGTWANLMKFPADVLDANATSAHLDRFIQDLAANNLERYVVFRPSYARIDIAIDGTVSNADLLDFNGTQV